MSSDLYFLPAQPRSLSLTININNGVTQPLKDAGVFKAGAAVRKEESKDIEVERQTTNMSIEMVPGMIVPEPRSTATQGFGDRGMGIGVQFQPPPVGTGTMGSYQFTGHVPIPMIGPMNQQVWFGHN